MLFTLTSILDFLGMGVSLWLAVYLLGRSLSRQVSLRGFIVLLGFAVFFLVSYVNLYKQVPGMAVIRAILLILSVSVWNDLTVKLYPAKNQRSQHLSLLAVYAFGFVAIMILLWERPTFASGAEDLLRAAAVETPAPYIVYSLFQLSVSFSIFYNLYVGLKRTVNWQTKTFLAASLLVMGVAGLEILALAWIAPPLSLLQQILALLIAILLSSSLERYETSVERRRTLEDFATSFVGIFWLAAVYVLIAWQLGWSPIAVIFVGVLAILTHSVSNLIRESLSRWRSRLEASLSEADLKVKPDELVGAFSNGPDPQFIKMVEEGLRNLPNFITLGQSPLAGYLGISGTNQIEQGKAVQRKIIQAIETLRPARDCPREPIPREWYSYMILHDAYQDCIPNQDIMSKLYISEGTFHRTRRAAVRAVTQALLDMRNGQGN